MKKPVGKATEYGTDPSDSAVAPSQLAEAAKFPGGLNQHQRERVYAQYVIYGRTVRQIAREFDVPEHDITEIIFERVAEDAAQRERRRARIARENEIASAFPVRKANA